MNQLKTLLITSLLLVVFGFTNSDPKPKIKTKDNIVSVDGVPYFYAKYNRLIGGIDIAKVDGTKLLFLRRQNYTDPSLVNKNNPTGKSSFYSMIREGQTEVLCELSYASNKYLAKLFLEYTILDENGNINDANLLKLAGQIGKTFSSKNVIIIH